MILRRLSHSIERGWQHPRWLNRLLYPLSLGYAGLMSARRHAYQLGVLKRHKLPVPVVVVGNISVGGVGKTPLVMELVAHFQSRGMKPGVVTRGYRGGALGAPRLVDENATAESVGDEPLLMFRRCQAPVMVGQDRVRGARLLVGEHGCDIIISDDGFQHLALARDLDLVVVDGERRFGNGWCLPAGPLREPPAALARAGLVVVNGEAGVDEFAMHAHIDRAVQLDGARIRELREFAGQTVHAVAGIGNPERFFRQLAAHDLTVVPHQYPDHHRFTPADLAFATHSHAAVLMTEKDAVKCEALALPREIASRCWAVRLRVTLDAQLLSAVRSRLP